MMNEGRETSGNEEEVSDWLYWLYVLFKMVSEKHVLGGYGHKRPVLIESPYSGESTLPGYSAQHAGKR